MANYTNDPVLGLTIPTPGVVPGEEYAVLISNDLSRIAVHTHTGAANLDGYQIPTAGLNINEDLSTQSNNITNLRSTRYIDQPSSLVGIGDLDCVYFENGDLWINNGAGIPIQITSGTLVNVISTNNYNVLDVSSNHSINSIDTDIVFSCSPMAGIIVITLPLALDVPIGRFYFVKDTSGTSETFQITINPNGGDTIDGTSTYVIHDNYAAVCLVRDTDTSWLLFKYDKKVFDEATTLKFNAASAINFVDAGAINFADTGSIDFDLNGSISFNAGAGNITMVDGGTIDLSGGTSLIDLSNIGVINNPGISKLTGVVSIGSVIVTSTPSDIEFLPSAGAKTVILVDTTTIAINVLLPSATDFPGMIVVIKDYKGNATTKNITVTPKGANKIEGLNVPKLISTSYGCLTLVSCAPSSSEWVMI